MSDFARIRNARPLLLTEEKRVLHFPKTNKIRIDNIASDVPEYRQADIKASRKEYANADAASKLGVVPKVDNYRERGNMYSYTQDYAGKQLPNKLEGINPKEQYKLGSQVGRIQNKLLTKDLGHTDLHEGNIVRPNPRRREAKLIDNESIRDMKDEYDKAQMKPHHISDSFTKGYNSRINFTQKQMRHFANFGFTNPVPSMLNKAQPYINNVKASGMAVADVAGHLSTRQYLPAQIAAIAGGVAGAAKGAGVGESEEEKANTSALGRAGKVFSTAAGGVALGGMAGVGAQSIGGGIQQRYSRRRPEYA